MNTCGTCKHFGDPIEDASDSHYIPTGYHVCRLIKQGERGEQVDDAALVVDASGYYAALCIKEEFGCNQWAERSANSTTCK